MNTDSMSGFFSQPRATGQSTETQSGMAMPRFSQMSAGSTGSMPTMPGMSSSAGGTSGSTAQSRPTAAETAQFERTGAIPVTPPPIPGVPEPVPELLQASLQEALAKNVGEFVVIEFLIGTNGMTKKQGILYNVGISYVTLYEETTKTFVICDFFSIKFVTFYLPGQRPPRNTPQQTQR